MVVSVYHKWPVLLQWGNSTSTKRIEFSIWFQNNILTEPNKNKTKTASFDCYNLIGVQLIGGKKLNLFFCVIRMLLYKKEGVFILSNILCAILKPYTHREAQFNELSATYKWYFLYAFVCLAPPALCSSPCLYLIGYVRCVQFSFFL